MVGNLAATINGVHLNSEGNKLVAVLENMYREIIEERVVDQVIGDYGTVPNDDLYLALKPRSRNLGEMDLYALAEYRAQAIDNNPDRSLATTFPDNPDLRLEWNDHRKLQ